MQRTYIIQLNIDWENLRYIHFAVDISPLRLHFDDLLCNDFFFKDFERRRLMSPFDLPSAKGKQDIWGVECWESGSCSSVLWWSCSFSAFPLENQFKKVFHTVGFFVFLPSLSFFSTVEDFGIFEWISPTVTVLVCGGASLLCPPSSLPLSKFWNHFLGLPLDFWDPLDPSLRRRLPLTLHFLDFMRTDSYLMFSSEMEACEVKLRDACFWSLVFCSVMATHLRARSSCLRGRWDPSLRLRLRLTYTSSKRFLSFSPTDSSWGVWWESVEMDAMLSNCKKQQCKWTLIFFIKYLIKINKTKKKEKNLKQKKCIKHWQVSNPILIIGQISSDKSLHIMTGQTTASVTFTLKKKNNLFSVPQILELQLVCKGLPDFLNMRMSKWRRNVHFWVKCPFKNCRY